MADTNSNGTIWFPNKRVIRTILQSIAAFIVALAGALAVFQIVAPQVLDAVRDVLPPTWYAWLVGFIAAVGVVAGALAKIMAIPQVNEWLKHFGAGTAPANQPLPDPVQEVVDQAVVRVLTDPIDVQVQTIQEAAARLGIPESEVLRDQWRDATGQE